jgi:hypothetical protein
MVRVRFLEFGFASPGDDLGIKMLSFLFDDGIGLEKCLLAIEELLKRVLKIEFPAVTGISGCRGLKKEDFCRFRRPNC